MSCWFIHSHSLLFSSFIFIHSRAFVCPSETNIIWFMSVDVKDASQSVIGRQSTQHHPPIASHDKLSHFGFKKTVWIEQLNSEDTKSTRNARRKCRPYHHRHGIFSIHWIGFVASSVWSHFRERNNFSFLRAKRLPVMIVQENVSQLNEIIERRSMWKVKCFCVCVYS